LVGQLDTQLDAASQPNNIKSCLASPASGDDEIASDGSTCAYFVVLYNAAGDRIGVNWKNEPAGHLPQVPARVSLAMGLEMSRHDFNLPSANNETTYRATATIVPLISADQENGTVIVAASTQQIDTVMSSYLTIFLGFGILVLTVGAGLTRMVVGTTFGPLREVEHTAAQIAAGDFSQRMEGATPNTEVGRLSRSLNIMLSRIDDALRGRAKTIAQMRRFVGDASHELRTPLVSLRGYAELYRMGALQKPEEIASAMDRIEREATRMGLLVQDLLQLARLDEEKPLNMTRVDLVPIARDAAMDVTASAPSRTVRVETPPDVAAAEDPAAAAAPPTPATPAAPTGPIAFAGATLARLRSRGKASRQGDAGIPGAPATEPKPLAGEAPPPAPPEATVAVLADENKIRQVITNLVGNALRYTDQGSPIEIRVQKDPAAARAVLEIVDHGEGIPEQLRDKIFQRFWRADTSRTRETGGSGLGLAIVASIVAAHHGTVEARETPGGGATFRIVLPLAPERPEAHGPHAATASGPYAGPQAGANPGTNSPAGPATEPPRH
ncbi:MAG TPA: HAMP domain-containing sensor histidine kinase, partial [Microbacteriaceae bacterium]|nr:HAMP domain-containing sensor histidine kinase [Microbacteriaceae bacterium]